MVRRSRCPLPCARCFHDLIQVDFSGLSWPSGADTTSSRRLFKSSNQSTGLRRHGSFILCKTRICHERDGFWVSFANRNTRSSCASVTCAQPLLSKMIVAMGYLSRISGSVLQSQTDCLPHRRPPHHRHSHHPQPARCQIDLRPPRHWPARALARARSGRAHAHHEPPSARRTTCSRPFQSKTRTRARCLRPQRNLETPTGDQAPFCSRTDALPRRISRLPSKTVYARRLHHLPTTYRAPTTLCQSRISNLSPRMAPADRPRRPERRFSRAQKPVCGRGGATRALS